MLLLDCRSFGGQAGASARARVAGGLVAGVGLGLLFNTRPLTAGTGALATATVAGTTGAWYEWDLTAYLNAEKAAGRTRRHRKTTVGALAAAAAWVAWRRRRRRRRS